MNFKVARPGAIMEGEGSMALSGPAPLHGRHRDKNGEVSKKHGNTLTGTLRKTYDIHFAPGCDVGERLSDVLHKL
ncbi:MAG: hypothetical protein JOZ05_00730, partial [Acetobacteraceae bacterium]|nr:hypothetical protein [Acetobacteraceae bacterium]